MLENIKSKFQLGDKVVLTKIQAGMSGVISVIIHPKVFWHFISREMKICNNEITHEEIIKSTNTILENWMQTFNLSINELASRPFYLISFGRMKSINKIISTANIISPEQNIEYEEIYWEKANKILGEKQ